MDIEENRRRALEWYHRNKERAKARVAKWQRDNPEKVKESRERRKVAIRDSQKRSYEKRKQHYVGAAVEWNRTHPERRRKTSRDYAFRARLKRYGITEKDFNRAQEEQGNCCAICGEMKILCIDHCHNTGQFRSLLCKTCNVGLGSFKDNPELLRKAALYVEEPRGRRF